MKKNKKTVNNKNIFYLSATILGILNAVCNIISMFKGVNKSYLFNFGIGEVCVNICATAFILLSAMLFVMHIITKKKDYILFSTILYITIILLQIPVFNFNLVLFISIGILILLILGLIKDKKIKSINN